MTFKLSLDTAHELIEGLFTEFAAAIAEGFCPNCRKPFSSSHGYPGWIWGRCSQCRESWEWYARPPGISVMWQDDTMSYHLHAFAPEVYEELEGSAP